MMARSRSPSDGTTGPDPFSIVRTERDDTVVLALMGELDIATVGQLIEAAAPVLPATQLVLDLEQLEFMESSGLRALMNLDLRARREGWALSLARPQPAVMRLLKLSSFGDRVPIRDAPA